MRRDYFTLNVTDVDWAESDGEPSQPRVEIDFHGPAETLRSRFEAGDGTLLVAEDTDVACRLQGPVDDPDTEGVVSVTNRLTGDFILELNEDAADILAFIAAARQYGEREEGDGLYRVSIRIDGEELTHYQKDTFLVYDQDGDLRRQHSLIPSGVEL
jgi:hypothetical protein